MLKIKFTGTYKESLSELLSDDDSLEEEINRRIGWFNNNSDDTRLDNHELTGKMEGKWAFSITDDIRIVYEWIGKNTARFLAIGGHQKVYKKNHAD